MRFTWNPRKIARNLEARGFDFAFASAIFTGPTVERIDARRDYGEVQRIAVGRFASLVWQCAKERDEMARVLYGCGGWR